MKTKLRMRFQRDKNNFTPEQRNIVRVVEVLGGTQASEGDTVDDMVATARKLFKLSNYESSIFMFAVKFPRLFLLYSAVYLKKHYHDLNIALKGGNKLFLVHNFVDSKITILVLIIKIITEGEKAVVFVEKPLMPFIRSIFASLLKDLGIAVEPAFDGYGFTVKMAPFSGYFGDGCLSSEINFVDGKKRENLSSTLKLLKENNYHLVLIPETPVENSKTVSLNCFGKYLNVPSGLKVLSGAVKSVVSVLTDASSFNFLPSISINEINGKDKTFFENFQNIIKDYERLAYVHPELFIPFNFPPLWKNLYRENDSKDIKIVNTLSLGAKNLILLSDGQIFMGSGKEIKDALYGYQTVLDPGC